MRKKLLTIALAAVMVLGSTVSAFAAGSSELNNSSSTTNGVETETDVTVSEETAATIEKAAKLDGITDTLLVAPVTKTVIQAVQTAGATLLKDKTFEILDLKLASGLTELGKTIKVTLPVFESLKDAKWIAVYRLDGTTLNLIDTVEVKDGAFTFETNHFSTYVFAETTAPANTDSTDTADTAPVAAAVAVAALAAASFAVVALKKKNA